MDGSITISETIEEIPAGDAEGFTYDVEIDVQVGFMGPDREVGYFQSQVTVDDWTVTKVELYDSQGELVYILDRLSVWYSLDNTIDKLRDHIQKWVDDNDDVICEHGAEEHANMVEAAQEAAAESRWERQQEDRWEQENER